MYRALQHPVYPILRKIERIGERIDVVRDATREGRVIYASNHKSHIDYLVQPLVLDDNGIRPPVIAAGINLFGGALGLIHKHVTGAIPDPPGNEGPRVPGHPEGLRRRVVAPHRPVPLPGGRTQLQRRAETVQDGAASMPSHPRSGAIR